MARKSNRRLLVDYGLTIVAAIAIALGIRMFLIEAYRIPSGAMRPTLLPGDTIFVSKWGYAAGGPREPARGEVIVFTPKSDPGLNFIKRVVGVAGETVEVKSGVVNLNGKAVTEFAGNCGRETPTPGLSYEVCRDKPALEDLALHKIPEGSVFVIGDLRAQGKGESKKARSWGIVPISTIKGRALWIWLSTQPREINEPSGGFPRIRWSRMFRSIK